MLCLQVRQVRRRKKVKRMKKEDMVVLVDENDRKTGLEEKMAAHQDGGKLHRAISVFVFDSKLQLMLQRRALSKYHTPGLWTNTCCSHPFDGEPILDAAHRRLSEEMGFDCNLAEAFTFIYHADVGNALTENEYDHVVVGRYDGKPEINPDEASDWKFAYLDEIERDMRYNPGKYTPWFKIVMPQMVEWAEANKENIQKL